jgi:hypothetical protein
MYILACQANQGSPVLETYRIPLEHSGRTIPILVRMIAIEKSVPKTLLLGARRVEFSLRTRLRSPPLAPFDESYDEGASVCHMLLRFKRATMRTTHNRLLQVFEILHPVW